MLSCAACLLPILIRKKFARCCAASMPLRSWGCRLIRHVPVLRCRVQCRSRVSHRAGAPTGTNSAGRNGLCRFGKLAVQGRPRDVYRASEQVPAIVESCIKLGVPRLWLQLGVIHEEAAQRARDAGLVVVMDRCIWRDFSYLCKPK